AVPMRSVGTSARLVRSPAAPRSSSRAMLARLRDASISSGVKGMASPSSHETMDRVAEQGESIPFLGQSLARPARMVRRQDMAFRMWHQAEHAPRRIAQPGDIALRTVGVEWIRGCTSLRIDIMQHDLSRLFQSLQQPFLAAKESPFTVRHRQ